MSILVSIVLLIVVVYSILGWTLYFMQPSFLYRPIREILYDPGDMDLAFEKVALQTEDGLKLAGWYVPAVGARYTILFCHGNSGNISHRLDTVNLWNELGFNILVFDYRGYGQSQGKPSEEGTYMDARAAWQWLRTVKHIPADRIIVHGRSLGGAIAARLAAQVEPAGLIVESTFTSYEDIGKSFYPYLPVHWFASFKYRTIDAVQQVRCPVLVVHSRNDELVPFEFGRRLFEAAPEPKRFVEIDGSHNDGFLFSGQVYRQGLLDWVLLLDRTAGQAGQGG